MTINNTYVYRYELLEEEEENKSFAKGSNDREEHGQDLLEFT